MQDQQYPWSTFVQVAAAASVNVTTARKYLTTDEPMTALAERAIRAALAKKRMFDPRATRDARGRR